MKTLTAEELMKALRKKSIKTHDEDEPDMTYASEEQRVEPSIMPSGQGEIK